MNIERDNTSQCVLGIQTYSDIKTIKTLREKKNIEQCLS